VTEYRNDEELLALLNDALSAAPIAPDETVRRRLLDALAHDNVVPFVNPPSRRGRLRRRLAGHATALTLATVGVVTVGGVAAAAVAADTLPGPTRAIAYDLGLPVTSPALYQARQQLNRLERATAQHHSTTAHEIGQRLIRDLGRLNHADLSQIRTGAQHALSRVDLLSQATQILGLTPTPTPTTTAATPTTSSTTSTTVITVPLTVPVIGSVLGPNESTGIDGVLKSTSSTATSLLP